MQIIQDNSRPKKQGNQSASAMQMRPLHTLIESNIADNISLVEQEFIWGMEWGFGKPKDLYLWNILFQFFKVKQYLNVLSFKSYLNLIECLVGSKECAFNMNKYLLLS